MQCVFFFCLQQLLGLVATEHKCVFMVIFHLSIVPCLQFATEKVKGNAVALLLHVS